MATKPKTESAPMYDPKAPADRPAAAQPVKTGEVDVRATAESGARNSMTQLPQHEPLKVDETSSEVTADIALASPESEPGNILKDIERIRALRKPFGTMTQKLALAVRPGYQRHWFNDEPGRVEEAEANGWAHVKDKEGKPVRRVVGRGRDSGALYAYAMELPKVFWDEDMAARHAAAQERMDGIKKSPFMAKPGQSQASDAGKFYSAKDEPLSIKQPHK